MNITEEELEMVTWRPDTYQSLDGKFMLEEKERPGELMEYDAILSSNYDKFEKYALDLLK